MDSIPDFIKLPTDNIYKFLAIAGLILIILCDTIPILIERDLSIQTIQTQGDYNTLNQEVNFLAEDISWAQNNKENLTVEQAQELQDRARQQLLKNIELNNKLNLLNFYKDELNQIWIFRWVVISIGILLAIIGFGYWYFRWQQPLDLIIRNETQKLKKRRKSLIVPVGKK
ncbi:MAG: hypothetical protein ABR954_02295 [Dehalococcoidales bacterium]